MYDWYNEVEKGRFWMANISTIRTTEAAIKITDFYMANIFSSSGEKG